MRPRAAPGAAAFALVALALGVASGCGGDDDGSAGPPKPVDAYVGKVQGAAAFVGLISDGDRVSGLVTDGNELAVWLAASDLDDGSAALASREGNDVGQVEFDGGQAAGEVKLGAETFQFQAQLASGKAGFFVAAGKQGEDSFQAGWVLLSDGSAHGTLDTFVDGAVTTREAPAIMPTIDVKGIGSAQPRELTTAYFDSVPAAPE
jgi:hypothetical protein